MAMRSGMEESSYHKLITRVKVRGFAAGSIIYKKNDPCEFAFIVLHGAVTVSVSFKFNRHDDYGAYFRAQYLHV